jgi:hypothetical protein
MIEGRMAINSIFAVMQLLPIRVGWAQQSASVRSSEGQWRDRPSSLLCRKSWEQGANHRNTPPSIKARPTNRNNKINLDYIRGTLLPNSAVLRPFLWVQRGWYRQGLRTDRGGGVLPDGGLQLHRFTEPKNNVGERVRRSKRRRICSGRCTWPWLL